MPTKQQIEDCCNPDNPELCEARECFTEKGCYQAGFPSISSCKDCPASQGKDSCPCWE